MYAPIKAQMNELVQNPPDMGPCMVTALSQRRWMIEGETGPVVQLELLDDDLTGFVYATVARDGSGPLRASFLTMLLLEDTIATAPLPAQPIPKSNASPGLLAHIATAKYCDALPLARQEQILARAGIDHTCISTDETLVPPLMKLFHGRA